MRGLIYHKFGNCAGRFASLGRVEHFEGAVRAVRGMGRALLYGERLGYAEPGGRFAKQGVQAWGFS